MTIVRFLALVVLLNVIRYLVGGLLESWTVGPLVMEAMGASPEVFNTTFTTADWVSSFLYNFVVWLVPVWVYHLARPALAGSDLVASFEIFALQWLLFAAVSGVYMNHYSHPMDFYLWNVVDAVLAFTVVAVANGLLYRPLMGSRAAPRATR